ncbi:MAG: aminotransferase class III-fold pyridoxal phosphate-dependent enzyme [Phycisphaerales bacterium]|nr:aminotransferase class III-fold pyridoxal phosphate-dependent enzyme [Phycisphaerales bacterium]
MTTKTAPALPVFNHKPSPYCGPSKAETLAMRQEFLSPAILMYYKDPVMIVEGSMQYLFDETGKRYLDGFAGIVTVSVGHCHPKVIEAIREQNERFQHTTTIYLHPNIAQYAKKLASTFPKDSGLSVCYFTNSGSESNDLALLMARAFTGNYDILALRNAYHGMSPTSMGLTALNTWKSPVPQGFGVHHAKCPDMYRGPFGYDDPDAGAKYAADVDEVIRFSTSGQVAAFIAEPIQGVGGTVELPDGYLKHVYKSVRAAGGLCISDEVQAGFGRTGTKFWGFENQGVTPDIITMAKGMATAHRAARSSPAPISPRPWPKDYISTPSAATPSPWPNATQPSTSFSTRTSRNEHSKSVRTSWTGSAICNRATTPSAMSVAKD